MSAVTRRRAPPRINGPSFAFNAERLISKGSLEALIELAPNHASGEQLADHDLLRGGARAASPLV